MALAPIRRAWQQQLDFTANASHELRTPLAALRLNLEIALAELEDIPEDKKKWLENSVAEADRMSELVEDLLTLSRADTGKQQLINEKVCVDRIIRKTIEPLRPQAGLAGLSIEMSLEQDVSLLCDEKRISQLVTILVDNAIKYSGREGVIHVELKKKEKQVQLEISDSGVGIAPEQLAQIFDRFYRADPARSAQNPGSGLGLSIAKWIAESHGGSILAESTVGKGTKFTVLIPNG
jgi:signal transduction histidine kinase